jgi:Flp pilus assembly pilin Flp
MLETIRSFRKNDDGAVTVDWVVLTAAVVGLAIASFASIQTGGKAVGDNVGEFLTETPVETLMSAAD